MSQRLIRVLVLGGTGHFGARICRRLLNEKNIKLLVSSRSESAAIQLVSELEKCPVSATVEAVVLDHTADSFEQDLAELSPDIVLHTAGPFQGQDYRVARACLACGSHYIDLADGRSFVDAFQQTLDEEAKDAGLLLVTGASTLPGLSSAVINQETSDWQSVEKLEITIAPARQTPRGLSTIQAVLGYCGKPFEILHRGKWQRSFGWQSLKVQRYSRLGTRLAAVCDVPDLVLLPQRIPSLHTVVFRAALESWLEHIALYGFAMFVRLGLVDDWANYATIFKHLSRISQSLGSDVGGMRIEIEGKDHDGLILRKQWDLVAGENHGPEIPVSPALVLTRKLLHGELGLTGAQPCFGLMSLDDFATEVAALDITWSTQRADIGR